MANLDKLLKKIEKNKETENETTTHPLTIAGETFEVSTMTRSEKQRFVYALEGKKNITAGEIVAKMKPFIYRALNLAELAVKAKDAGYIKSYYDVIDALFEPDEILEIVGFIMDINGISKDEAEKTIVNEVEDIKKP